MLKRYLPILDWGREYTKQTFVNDLTVAMIVTFMLIPQSLAYAQLAGLPAQVGLYASIAPLLVYAVFGTSRSLAVGPVAVVSLMTAAAVAPLAAQGSPEYLGAAMALAMVSGLILTVLGLLKLGFLANFLSHPVIAGFITASGIQIAASQLSPLLGIPAHGHSFVEVAMSLWENVTELNPATVAIGVPTLVFLFWARKGLRPLMRKLRLSDKTADLVAKLGPLVALAATTVAAWAFDLADRGVDIVGEVPKGLPSIALPPLDPQLWMALAVPALLISIIGYAESISVAQTLASKKRQRVDPDQELIALGLSNVGAAVTGGFPVTGGLSRSVVNYEAGAETPAAGAFTAVGIALATMFLTGLLFFLPSATLGAVIIVAVLSLVDFRVVKTTWDFSHTDAVAMVVTIVITLIWGVELGLIAGVALSIVVHLYNTSKPHTAVVGQVPGTEHFRNVLRHEEVITDPEVVSMRVDESLYFPNARFLEDRVNQLVAANPEMRHFILVSPAVNAIDASALESLEEINRRLEDAGVTFHLSEVKGPVMDRLKRSHFLEELTGEVHLTQYDAVHSINPELAERALAESRS